ncbi:hypothetical protein GIB67_004536 [Kingdonia uniflora]|uniref:Beta-catenin-like protein 1 N-terminal domain-containing protein n=1 Tax=Kingdonia uniflora TaxID=39325 RepID=A0A7J7ML47_9MAGN|nr:hypothetical protein GIB67_004536 [Kingdonia uniflora]
MLNFIDVLWSSCGGEQGIVVSSNYVEHLDPALILYGKHTISDPMDIIEAQSPISTESAGQMFEFLLYPSDYPVKENGSVLSIPKVHDRLKCLYLVETMVPVKYGKSFVEGRMFIVTDNLKVIPQSPEPYWALFKDIGIKEGCEAKAQTEEKISSDAKITVKIIIRKSNNKILFVEAGKYFVDFLFIILVLPLGSVVKFLERTPNLGCISTLYKSVGSSEFDRFITSSCRRKNLLSPIIAPRLWSENRILDIGEIIYLAYKYKGITQKAPSNALDKVTSYAVVNPNPMDGILRGSRRDRLINKFVESEYQKIDCLMELFTRYSDIVKADIERMDRIEFYDLEMDEEERNNKKLESRLHSLQVMDVVVHAAL